MAAPLLALWRSKQIHKISGKQMADLLALLATLPPPCEDARAIWQEALNGSTLAMVAVGRLYFADRDGLGRDQGGSWLAVAAGKKCGRVAQMQIADNLRNLAVEPGVTQAQARHLAMLSNEALSSVYIRDRALEDLTSDLLSQHGYEQEAGVVWRQWGGGYSIKAPAVDVDLAAAEAEISGWIGEDTEPAGAKPANVGAARQAKADAARAEAKATAEAKPDPVPVVEPIVGPSLTVCASEIPGASEKRTEKTPFDASAWAFLNHALKLSQGPALKVLESVLLAEFPWMSAAIAAVIGDLQLRQNAGQDWAHWRPLCLVGQAGCGKTRFAQRLGALLGVGYSEVSAGGSSDNRAFQGTARGWSTAQPAQVLQAMRLSKTANPVVLVDELDKTNAGNNGDIRQTLLSMLEPISAKAWPDECLMVPCDLSQVNWIVTANSTERLKGPLLTRLRVVEVPMPGLQHFDGLMAGIRRDFACEMGISIEDLPELPGAAEAKLKEAFRKGISIRRVKAAWEAGIGAGSGFGGGRPCH